MKLLPLYKWIAGSTADFTSQFKNNETLFNQARSYWNKMEASSIILVCMFFILGVGMACYYYGPYNNHPGRHYKPNHWLGFLGGTFLLTFVLTMLFLQIAVSSNLDGVILLHLKMAFANALYSSALYLLVSWIWCQCNIPTNACRFFKF